MLSSPPASQRRARASASTASVASEFAAVDWSGVTLPVHDGSACDAQEGAREGAKSRAHSVLFRRHSTPLRIAHFNVLERLGSGGMGEVFLAYDEQLARHVAIKLVRSEHGRKRSANQRLLREARTLARISHPNVVHIYHVGVHQGRVFIAMELVPGRTLREWLEAGQRSWSEILDTYLAAGRGLTAAHEQGLVHRDFKPENVLISDTGRVRVVDFGLAGASYHTTDGGADDAPRARSEVSGSNAPGQRERVSGGATDGARDGMRHGGDGGFRTWDGRDPSSGEVAGVPISDRLPRMTAAGAVLGTPAYMSPEQRAGQPTDSRTDQFSFCVALYEALYGELPFKLPRPGRDQDPLVMRPVPRNHDVPRRVHRVLVRGLAPDPADRHPSMEALLAELTRTTAPRGRLALGGLAACTLATALFFFAQPEEQAPCTTAGESVVQMWNDEIALALRHAFVTTGAPYASDSFVRVRQGLDTYTGELRDMNKTVCEATRVSGEQPQELFVVRSLCLEERGRYVSALIDSLREPDREGVARSVQAIAELPDVASCRTDTALAAGPLLPAWQRSDAVDEIRELMSQSHMRQLLGDIETAGGLARESLRRAESLDHEPLVAEALFRLADTQLNEGTDAAYERAEETLFRALDLAETHRRDELVADVWNHLVLTSIRRHGDLDTAYLWARRALAASRRIGDERRETRALSNIGRLHFRAHRLHEAQDMHRQALALAEESHLSDFHRAQMQQDLANTLADRGEHEEAARIFQDVEETVRRDLGDNSLHLASVLHDAGRHFEQLGAFERAEDKYQGALELRLAVFDERHMTVGLEYLALANVAQKRAELDRAIELAHAALRVFAATVAPDHPYVGTSHSIIGDIAMQRDRPGEALHAYRNALAAQEPRLGSDSITVAITHANIGHAELASGNPDQALVHTYRAAEIMESLDRTDDVRPALRGLVELRTGQALAARGDHLKAFATLTRARAALANESGYRIYLAETLWSLARVTLRLHDRGAASDLGPGDTTDHDDVRSLAREARVLCAELGHAGQRLADDISTWLHSEFPERGHTPTTREG